MSDLRLVLARHGQTQANVDRVLDTVLPGPPLTELGRAQARALGRELADGAEGTVTALYHSPARRARETADLVAAQLDLAPVEVTGVHEVQVGALEGRNDEPAIDEFRRVVDRWQSGDLDAAQPGGETGRELLARYLPVVADLRERHADGDTVVLVSHGAALRLVAQELVEHVGTPRADEEHVANCGRVVVRPRAGGWELVAWRSAVPGGLPATDDPTG